MWGYTSLRRTSTLELSARTDNLEAEFSLLCQQAALTPFQQACAWGHLRGLSAGEIAEEVFPSLPADMKRKNVHRHLRRRREDVREAVETAARLLHEKRSELRDAGDWFVRNLVFCAADRRVYDEREEGVSGVEPAPEAKGFRAGPVITGGDRRLIQDARSCLRLWGQEQLGTLRTPREAAFP